MLCRVEKRVIFARKPVIRRETAGSLKNGRRKTPTGNLGETLRVIIPAHQFRAIIVGKKAIFLGNAEENVEIKGGEESYVITVTLIQPSHMMPYVFVYQQ